MRALADAHVLAEATGAAPAWTPLEPAAAGPAGRFGHAAAFDPATRRLLVYGGTTGGVEDGLNYVFSDAWLLTNADGLGARRGVGARRCRTVHRRGASRAAAAWSAGANRLILFGGANNKLATPPTDLWLLGDSVGQLPLASAGQPASSYEATEAADGNVYLWRVVTRDPHGAWRGSPAWSFTVNRPPVVDAGPDQARRRSAGYGEPHRRRERRRPAGGRLARATSGAW